MPLPLCLVFVFLCLLSVCLNALCSFFFKCLCCIDQVVVPDFFPPSGRRTSTACTRQRQRPLTKRKEKTVHGLLQKNKNSNNALDGALSGTGSVYVCLYVPFD